MLDELQTFQQQLPDWQSQNEYSNIVRNQLDLPVHGLLFILPVDLDSWDDENTKTHTFRLYFQAKNCLFILPQGRDRLPANERHLGAAPLGRHSRLCCPSGLEWEVRVKSSRVYSSHLALATATNLGEATIFSLWPPLLFMQCGMLMCDRMCYDFSSASSPPLNNKSS